MGRCQYCIVLATILTVLSWAGFFVVRRNFALPWLSMAIMIFGCLVSLLLLTHVVAFFAREATGSESNSRSGKMDR